MKYVLQMWIILKTIVINEKNQLQKVKDYEMFKAGKYKRQK
jgi:hypothetical protein